MSAIYKKFGSVKAGWRRSGWGLPLIAERSALVIHTVFQSFRFVPNDVVAVIPSYEGFTGQIRVCHTLEEYPAEIWFCFFGDADEVIAGIDATGFRPNGANVPPRLKPEPKFVLRSKFSDHTRGVV